MKISEILNKEFKTAPTLSELIDFIESSDLILKYFEGEKSKSYYQMFYLTVYNYNNFLKQPITLSMLVPCKDGEVLEEPCLCRCISDEDECRIKCVFDLEHKYNYKKAQEEVLTPFPVTNWESKTSINISTKDGRFGIVYNREKETFMLFDSEGEEDEYLITNISQLAVVTITDNYFNFLNK